MQYLVYLHLMCDVSIHITLAFYKYVIVPMLESKGETTNGEDSTITLNNRSFKKYEEIEEAFRTKELTEEDLKEFLIRFINEILGRVQVCRVLFRNHLRLFN